MPCLGPPAGGGRGARHCSRREGRGGRSRMPQTKGIQRRRRRAGGNTGSEDPTWRTRRVVEGEAPA
eukprot:2074379-Pyramimonas_sp.AAC.1